MKSKQQHSRPYLTTRDTHRLSQMASKQSRKIAIVGGSGSVGSPTVEALLSQGIHAVTAISRSKSTATFPSGVTVKRGSYNDENFLVEALKGQDVLILQLQFMALDSQIPLINAAAKLRSRGLFHASMHATTNTKS